MVADSLLEEAGLELSVPRKTHGILSGVGSRYRGHMPWFGCWLGVGIHVGVFCND